MNDRLDSSQEWLSFALAFVGGWGDASGFLIAKTFTGHVTGNLVLAAIAIGSGDWRGVAAHFSAVLCFLSGIPLNALVTRFTARCSSLPPLVTSVAIELVLVLAACLALAVHAAASLPLFVTSLALALGLQNAAFRRAGAISLHTTYLTGTITSLLAPKIEQEALHLAPPKSEGTDAKARLISAVCAAFVLGAATAAGIVLRSRQLGMLVLALCLLVILVRCWLRLAADKKQAAQELTGNSR